MKNKSKILTAFLILTAFITSVSGAWTIQSTYTEPNGENLGQTELVSNNEEIFVGTFDGTLHKLNNNFTELNSYSSSKDFVNYPLTVTGSNELTFLNDNSGDIEFYDYTPSLLSTTNYAGLGNGVDSSFAVYEPDSNRLYHIGTDSNFNSHLVYLDLSDNSINDVEQISDSSTDLAYYNNKIYYTTGGNLKTHDTTTSSSTSDTGLDVSSSATSSAMDIENGNLYWTDGLQVEKYDISEATNTDLFSFSSIEGKLQFLDVSPSEQFLAIADSSQNLRVYDSAQSYSSVYTYGNHGFGTAEMNWDGQEYLYITRGGGLDKIQSSGVLKPPTATINQPQDGETKTLNYGESTKSFNYDFSVETEGLDTNYTVYVDGSIEEEGTVSASGSLQSVTGTFSVGEGNHDIYLEATNSGGTDTTQTRTVTVNSKNKPTIKLQKPDQNSYFFEGTSENIPFEGYVEGSEESGTAYFEATFEEGTTNEYTISEEVGAVNTNTNQSFSDSYDLQTTWTDIDGDENPAEWSNIKLKVEYGSGSFESNTTSFSFKRGFPYITSDSVEPSGLNNLSVGQSINSTISGEITRDAVDRIEYSLDTEQGSNPSTVTVNNIDFQDQNQFTHSEKNIFEIKEAYQGGNIEFTVEVFDTEGRKDTVTYSGTLGSPPDELITNSPTNNQLFLIPDGETETEVDIEWGVDTSNYNGTAELLVDGSVVDSFQIGANSQNVETYSANYTEGEYSWKVRFEDSLGNSYESLERNFKVTDEPIGLTLKSPSANQEFNLLDRDSISVDHTFEIDSRALPEDYYYRFELTNDDTSTTVRNRTSNTFDSGVDTYTQSVSNLENASYTFSVKVFRSTDDTQLESASRSYTIVKEPLFDISIDNPVDGSVYQVEPGNTTDVTVRYSVETFAQATDFELKQNGTVVDTKSVSQGTAESFRTTLNSLSADTYRLTLSGEDTDGNTNSTSVQFEIRAVEEEDEEVPEVYTAEFRPPITEARVGDELDLYIEGSQFPEDVDFVDVKVETGAGTKTFTVPGDQLNRQNSFNYTVEDALTVTSAMLGNPVAIYGSLQSVAGDVSSFFFDQGDAGESTTIGAVPNYPTSNVSIPQPPGVSEDVRFDFNVNSLSQEVDYQVLVKDEGTPGYGLVGGSVGDSSLEPIPPNSNENVVMYRNMDDELFVNQSRGQFKWKVVVFTGDGSESDDSKEYSRTADFQIVDSNTTTLNFLNPSDNSELEIAEGNSVRDVKFDFSVDTPESGRLYLELYDDTVDANPDIIYDEQVGSGKTPDSDTETLEEGSYSAVLHFENQNTDINRTRDFSIVPASESTECENPTVNLRKPTYDILYSDSSYVFEWSVCNPNNYDAPTSVDSPSNTTLYIEDDEGTVQKSFFEEYDTQDEVLSFSPRVNTNFPQGEYVTYANFSYPNTTIQSNVKNFQIVDFTKPESFNLQPDGRSFKSSEEIPISWTTQAYEENVEARAKIKRVGEYKANTVKVADISANSKQDFSDTITRSPGEYEFYIDMEVSPEGSASPMTFQSNKTTFEVTSANLPKANFTLIEPEQGAEYDVPNGSNNATVPFAFDVDVAGEKDWKIDLLVQDVGEETGFIRRKRFTLPGTAGSGSFNESLELEESGYRYKIRAVDPNNEETVSTTRSFVVDNPETAEVPELPNPDPDVGFFEKFFNSISGAIAGFVAIVGTAGLFFVATALTVATGMVIHLLTESDGLSLLSMLATVVFFVGIGWYPGWVGMILFLGSAGIFMYTVGKVTSGGE